MGEQPVCFRFRASISNVARLWAAVDVDYLGPSPKAYHCDIDLELAYLVIIAEVATELDVLETLNAVCKEPCCALREAGVT